MPGIHDNNVPLYMTVVLWAFNAFVGPNGWFVMWTGIKKIFAYIAAFFAAVGAWIWQTAAVLEVSFGEYVYAKLDVAALLHIINTTGTGLQVTGIIVSGLFVSYAVLALGYSVWTFWLYTNLCRGQSSAFSIEIATWRITTAATKATGTVLTDADEVLSFEAMLRAYNEKIKRFQANNHPAGGGHFKPLFKAFSTDVREPCQWCLKNLNKSFFHKEQDCRIKNQPPLARHCHGDKRASEQSACFICKEQGHQAAACPQVANFQAMVQQ